MARWVRYCRTVVGWDGERIPEGAPREEWADPNLVTYCGRLGTERVYGDDELAKAVEEEWTCPACGGTEHEFTEWPPRTPKLHGGR
jgi:hypothetical protein